VVYLPTVRLGLPVWPPEKGKEKKRKEKKHRVGMREVIVTKEKRKMEALKL